METNVIQFNAGDLPVQHLSPSSINLLCCNQQMFIKNYILGEWDIKVSPSLIVGKSVHWGLAEFWRLDNRDPEKEKPFVLESALKYARKQVEEAGENMDFGKTGSMESIEKEITMAIDNYFNNLPTYTPIFVEYGEVVQIADMNGEVMPVPLKGYIDVVSQDDEGNIIIDDHKIVASFADESDDTPQYYIQAGAYFFMVYAMTGKRPKEMRFTQIRKSEAKIQMLQAELRKLCDEHEIDWATGNNGKYMTNDMMSNALIEKGVLEKPKAVQVLSINYEERPEVIEAFLEVYKRAINYLYFLSKTELKPLPNFGDMLTGKDAWKSFKQDLEGRDWKALAVAGVEAEPYEF